MKYRYVSLYVEWTDDEETDTVRKLLRSHGIQIIGVDRDTDLKYTPGSSPRHDNAIFRFRTDRKEPLYIFLSEVAILPCVYSVGEVHGLFHKTAQRLKRLITIGKTT